MIALAFGFILGFMGYVPPGNINMTVVLLALNDRQNRLRFFILFAVVMEFLYCLGCLTGLDLLLHQGHLVIVLKWISVVIFALLGLLSFFHNEDTSKIQALSGFGRGVFATVINPLQIPFWLIWGVYLTENKWLRTDIASTALFSAVTSVGTLCILWLYAVGGKRLVEQMKLERKLLDRLIGILLISLAVWQLFKLLHELKH
jgi:threonine/homoserine/homoserine lactone efflux protein